MSRGQVLGAAAGAFAVCVALAFAWDSVRGLRAARADLTEADRELRLHEERVVSIMDATPDVAASVRPDTAAWTHADGRNARHAAYRRLATTARGLAARDQRVGDQIAGALNRWDVAQRHYADVEAACEEFVATWRGSLAATLMRLPAPCIE